MYLDLFRSEDGTVLCFTHIVKTVDACSYNCRNWVTNDLYDYMLSVFIVAGSSCIGRSFHAIIPPGSRRPT
jgi:hypothetical protein